MITDVNCGLSLQLTCLLVNSSTTNKALLITRMTRILITKGFVQLEKFVVHIIKFNVQTSMFKV